MCRDAIKLLLYAKENNKHVWSTHLFQHGMVMPQLKLWENKGYLLLKPHEVSGYKVILTRRGYHFFTGRNKAVTDSYFSALKSEDKSTNRSFFKRLFS